MKRAIVISVLTIALAVLSGSGSFAHPFIATQMSRVMISDKWIGACTHLCVSGSPALTLRSLTDSNKNKLLEPAEKERIRKLLAQGMAAVLDLNLNGIPLAEESPEALFNIIWGTDIYGDFPLHIVYAARFPRPAEPVVAIGLTARPLDIALLPDIVPAAIVEVMGDESVAAISCSAGVQRGPRKITSLIFPAGVTPREISFHITPATGPIDTAAARETLEDFITWAGTRKDIADFRQQMETYNRQDLAVMRAANTASVEIPAELEGYDTLFGSSACADDRPADGPADADHPDRLVSMLYSGKDGIGFYLGALAVACVLGALHALSPGHGKSLVAAYLVGTKGRAIDAVILGITVTIAHVGGVLTLGVLTLALSDYFLPQKMVPYIESGAGLLVILVGGVLIITRSRSLARGESLHHDHEHHDHEHHSHDHHHEKTSLTGLLLLGISGGIVPCPAAFVVLLVALSINRLAMGLAMLLAFSLGLGLVLIVIAYLVTRASPLLARFSGQGVLVKLLPLYSAILVSLLGCGILAKALIDLRIISINI